MNCGPPGSSVHGILQARVLEWDAISFSRGSSWPRDGTHVSGLAGRFFITEPPGKPVLCPRLTISSLLVYYLENTDVLYLNLENSKIRFSDLLSSKFFILKTSKLGSRKVEWFQSAFEQLLKLLLICSISGKIQLCKRRSAFLVLPFITVWQRLRYLRSTKRKKISSSQLDFITQRFSSSCCIQFLTY